MMRRAAVLEAGVFWEDLFIFMDDIEWCIRIRQMGWAAMVVPESVVYHPPNAFKSIQPWRLYYSVRNVLVVMRRYGKGLRALWHQWRKCVDISIRTPKLLRVGELALALANQKALEHASAWRLGSYTGLPFRREVPDGWREVSFAADALPGARIAVVMPTHEGECRSILTSLIKELGGRVVLIAIERSYVDLVRMRTPRTWKILPVPQRGRARRTTLKRMLVQWRPDVVVESGSEIPAAEGRCLWQWRMGRLVTPVGASGGAVVGIRGWREKVWAFWQGTVCFLRLRWMPRSRVSSVRVRH